MTEKIKSPSVPTDHFTHSYQNLVDGNYLFPKGSGYSKQPGSEVPNYPSSNPGAEFPSYSNPQQSYSEEVSLWKDTSDILKSLVDQETKTIIAQKIVGI